MNDMKFFLTSLLILCSNSLFSQEIEGTWSGELDFGLNKLAIVFHFSKNSDGTYRATADSPDQNAKNIPIQSLEYNYPSLKLSINKIGVVYGAKVNGDTLIDGSFFQNGQLLNLKLRRGDFIRLRPQEPKPPFDYRSVDVTFSSKNKSVGLSGTMTLPGEGGKSPAVILVSGSGAQNRNEEMFGHKPFLLLADYLTKRGIAVLRYDDRGVGLSSGDFASATMTDFADDVLGAVEYLRQCPDIDKKRIGIIGHSEGGTVAFISAAQESSIAFVVSMAGMAVKGSDVLLKQNEDVLRLQGVPQLYTKLYCAVLSKIYNIVEENRPEEIRANMTTIADTLFSKDELNLPASLRGNALEVISALIASPSLCYMLRCDAADYISQMGDTPILALYGKKDCQVNADMNITSIKENSHDGRRRNSYHEYDNINHLFQNCVTGNVNEYIGIEETISEEVLADIAAWIKLICKN